MQMNQKKYNEDIDALYAQIMGRGPASSPVQAMETTVIEGEMPQPIEYPAGYRPKLKESEIIRENFNYAIGDRNKDASDIQKNMQGSSKDVSQGKERMRSVLDSLRNSGTAAYAPDQELEVKIQEAAKARDAGQYPERDLLTEAILGFGPAVLGGLTGEAGQLAQAPANVGARNLYEGQRKEMIERYKEQRNKAEATYKELLAQKSKNKESWDKSQQRELDRLKTVMGAEKDMTQMSLQDLQRQEQMLNEINKGVLDKTTSGALEVAKMERGYELEKNKDSRARIMAQIAQKKADLPTEGERKGAFQLGLMQQGEQNLQDLKKKYGNYPSMNDKWFRSVKNIASGMFGTTMMSDFLNSKMISEPTRQQIQAELSFLESIGRIQSGAAINIGEWSQMREQYFPTFGDSAELVNSKEQQRKTAMDGVKIIAGRAKDQVSAPQSTISKDSFPRVVRKGTQKATVSNEQELKEAMDEGWK